MHANLGPSLGLKASQQVGRATSGTFHRIAWAVCVPLPQNIGRNTSHKSGATSATPELVITTPDQIRGKADNEQLGSSGR